jgi:predicted ATP-dependent serine protease
MNECGYYSTYVQGCRCDLCKQANSSYQRKYKSTPERKAKNVRHAKRRNRAAMLALRYLRDNNPRAYYEVMDEAREWIDATNN